MSRSARAQARGDEQTVAATQARPDLGPQLNGQAEPDRRPRRRGRAAREAAATVHPASSLLELIPVAIREPMQYIVARSQMGNESEALPHRIAVTSCTHGDGVTTTVRALAAAMVTDLDATVCLIDLSVTAAGSPVGGLASVVEDGKPIDDALLATVDERLFVLPAGAPDAHTARTLARTTEFSAALTRLDDRFDYILFDSPPLLDGSDALALLRHADGYLLVVRHGVTTVDQISAVADELRSLKSLGVVMNQFSTKIPRRLRRFFAA
jgi:Mrp family chromosome partitioning ATPase